MAVFLPILFMLFAAGWAGADPLLIDVKACAQALSTVSLEQFVSEHQSRMNLGSDAGTFIPGDAKDSKLIDVRGANAEMLAATLIRHLDYDQDQLKNPDLLGALRGAIVIAQMRPAVFSISSWKMPDGKRTIRVSLDMTAKNEDRAVIVRLPDLEIRNGTPVRRVDIDINPSRLTLLTGTTQAVKHSGQWLIGEAASHSLGLEIDRDASGALVLDSFGAEATRFVGAAAQPELHDLLLLTEQLGRLIEPATKALQLRVMDEIGAVSEGRGWQLIN